MNSPAVHQYGTYTVYDLDALPGDGKRYELADGWLTELSPSPWHDQRPADSRTSSGMRQGWPEPAPTSLADRMMSALRRGYASPVSLWCPAMWHAPSSAGRCENQAVRPSGHSHRAGAFCTRTSGSKRTAGRHLFFYLRLCRFAALVDGKAQAKC